MFRYFPYPFSPPSILEQCSLPRSYENMRKSETFVTFSGRKVKRTLILTKLIKSIPCLEKTDLANLKFNMQIFAP